jgi:hypothetical protein
MVMKFFFRSRRALFSLAVRFRLDMDSLRLRIAHRFADALIDRWPTIVYSGKRQGLANLVDDH